MSNIQNATVYGTVHIDWRNPCSFSWGQTIYWIKDKNGNDVLIDETSNGLGLIETSQRTIKMTPEEKLADRVIAYRLANYHQGDEDEMIENYDDSFGSMDEVKDMVLYVIIEKGISLSLSPEDASTALELHGA